MAVIGHQRRNTKNTMWKPLDRDILVAAHLSITISTSPMPVLSPKIARSGDDQVVTFNAFDWQFFWNLWSYWLLMTAGHFHIGKGTITQRSFQSFQKFAFA